MRKLYSVYVRFCLSAFVMIFVVSCSKYDEGGYSLNAKKKISATTWELDTIISDSFSNTSESNSSDSVTVYYEFSKSGDFFQKTYTNDSLSSLIDGTWEFEEKKHKINITVGTDFIFQYFVQTDDIGYSYEELMLLFQLLQIPEEYKLVCDIKKFTKEELWITTTIQLPMQDGIDIEMRLLAK